MKNHIININIKDIELYRINYQKINKNKLNIKFKKLAFNYILY